MLSVTHSWPSGPATIPIGLTIAALVNLSTVPSGLTRAMLSVTPSIVIQTLPSGPSASGCGVSGRSKTLSTTGAADAAADARTVAMSAAVKSFGRWVVRMAAILSRRVRGMGESCATCASASVGPSTRPVSRR